MTATPTATATATPMPGVKKACDNDLDDDGDGQTDWEDPGCTDAGDTTENSEIPAPAACAATSGIGMTDDPTELTVGINPECGPFWEAEVQVEPGVASCTANNDYECVVYDPIASAHKYDGQRDAVDMTLQLKGPVDCAKKATIALNRVANGVDLPAIELQMFVRDCKTLPPPAAKCANGKDDDGDGMIDARTVAGVLDPDPGCAGPADTTENSEAPAPATCEIGLGLLNSNKRYPGVQVEGCGVITGAWFRTPGTADLCGYWFGDDDAMDCQFAPATVATSFAPTNMKLTLVARITADHDCRPVTVALTREDGSVLFRRQGFCD